MAAKIRKGDIILIVSVLVVAGVLAVSLNTIFAKEIPGFAVIKSNGEVWRRVPLNKDAAYIYEADGSYNVIVIENGRARMSEAGCPDKLCVRQGAIGSANAVIVCLPNRVTVHIDSSAPDPGGIDAVSG